jgi:iron complex transport system ATP-binding protein
VRRDAIAMTTARMRYPSTVASTERALEVLGVSFAYRRTGPSVLHDVAFDVKRGELLGILGPNGAGKSTLLRVLAGLVAPTAGSVSIGGVGLASTSRGEIARRLALVPQQEPSVFGFTARELVAMGRAPHTGLLGTLDTRDDAAVERALKRCDAASLASRPFAELSGGEQKRVLIARALAQAAPLVLLDEPVAFLDIHHQLAICDLLASAVADGEFTAVAVLHDLNLAAQYCQRLLLLREGRVVALGSVSEVMSYRQIRETFEAEVYVGENELNHTRYFVPMRAARSPSMPDR